MCFLLIWSMSQLPITESRIGSFFLSFWFSLKIMRSFLATLHYLSLYLPVNKADTILAF